MCHSRVQRFAEAGFFECGGRMRKAGILFFFGAVACASLPSSTGDNDPGALDQRDHPVRIAVATSAQEGRIGGVGEWVVYHRNSLERVMRGKANEEARLVLRSGRLDVVKGDGAGAGRFAGPLIVRSLTPGALLRYA